VIKGLAKSSNYERREHQYSSRRIHKARNIAKKARELISRITD
jgi:hypothetical protein